MSSDLVIINLLNRLPTRDRDLYLLIQSYYNHLSKFDNSDQIVIAEAHRLLSEMYEPKIESLVSLDKHGQFSRVPLHENKEDSILSQIDKELDEKLNWHYYYR